MVSYVYLLMKVGLLRLVFPQWQGSGKRKYVYFGAKVIRENPGSEEVERERRVIECKAQIREAKISMKFVN